MAGEVEPTPGDEGAADEAACAKCLAWGFVLGVAGYGDEVEDVFVDFGWEVGSVG